MAFKQGCCLNKGKADFLWPSLYIIRVCVKIRDYAKKIQRKAGREDLPF
jgi:hypothetical protein